MGKVKTHAFQLTKKQHAKHNVIASVKLNGTFP